MVGTTDIEFGAEDSGLALSSADASLPLPSLDPMLVAAAEHLATAALAAAPRQGAFSEVVAAKIEALLPVDVSGEVLAAEMKMSARTLQRRLEDEGVRFSLVLDGVRERIAKRLLREEAVPLTEIAFRLGFSDLATFSRAFKRWTGIPPGGFRRAARERPVGQ
jgi:AraC-like DNA-binding protein